MRFLGYDLWFDVVLELFLSRVVENGKLKRPLVDGS